MPDVYEPLLLNMKIEFGDSTKVTQNPYAWRKTANLINNFCFSSTSEVDDRLKQLYD